MKKAGRWILGSVGTLVALSALFIWDAIRRAEAAIDAHERQVAFDIAALRASHARRPPPPPNLPRPYSLGLGDGRFEKEIADLSESGRYFNYEHEDNPDPVACLYLDRDSFFRGLPSPAPPPHQLLSRLAYAQDQFRGGGFYRAQRRQCLESNAIRCWQDLIENRSIPAREFLRLTRIMDELHRTRPSVRETIEEERAIHRFRIIQVLRTRSDKHGTLREAPGWQSLFLWRVFIAKTLSSTNRLYLAIDRIASLPTDQREAAVRRLIEDVPHFRASPAISQWGKGAPDYFSGEAETLREWSLMRLATAIAWFEVEHARFPEKLELLTPQYIERIPVNPVTGLPFFYSDGTLAGSAEPGEQQVWRIPRKSEDSGKPRDP